MQHVWYASRQPHFCRLDAKRCYGNKTFSPPNQPNQEDFSLNTKIVYICTSPNQSAWNKNNQVHSQTVERYGLFTVILSPPPKKKKKTIKKEPFRDRRLPSYCRTWTGNNSHWQMYPTWQQNQGNKWAWGCSNHKLYKWNQTFTWERKHLLEEVPKEFGRGVVLRGRDSAWFSGCFIYPAYVQKRL